MNNPCGVVGDYQSGAVFNLFGGYRYVLWRRWDNSNGREMGVVMLNPSTADHETLDPTVATCVRLAKRDGFGGVVVYNLFALRSTDPKLLRTATDPVGKMNDEYLAALTRPNARKDTLVVAWGNHGGLNDRDKEVLKLLRGVDLYCLGVTKVGFPRHPLYTRKDVELVRYYGRV